MGERDKTRVNERNCPAHANERTRGPGLKTQLNHTRGRGLPTLATRNALSIDEAATLIRSHHEVFVPSPRSSTLTADSFDASNPYHHHAAANYAQTTRPHSSKATIPERPTPASLDPGFPAVDLHLDLGLPCQPRQHRHHPHHVPD